MKNALFIDVFLWDAREKIYGIAFPRKIAFNISSV
jgi:hypothetical protein